MKRIIYFLVLFFLVNNVLAQEEEPTEWKPNLFITGYVNTIAEFTDLEKWKEANNNIGIGLSEVGFLASYKPVEKLELKTTLVYKHKVPDIQSMLVEAYGQYKINEHLKIAAGKFLTPLSPVNVYFYAPVNPSGVNPMIVSHHTMQPQSISGFQLSGAFGTDIKTGYNLTYGNYTTKAHILSGIIGLLGYEDAAPLLSGGGVNEDQDYDLGGSARLYADFGPASFGINLFEGSRAKLAYVELVYDTNGVPTGERTSIYAPSSKRSFGIDAHLNINDKLKINAEYWTGYNRTTDFDDNFDVKYEGYYGELIYNTGIFKPYVRYEYVNDYVALFFPAPPATGAQASEAGVSIRSIGGGFAIRPLYELLIKMDYRNMETFNNETTETIVGTSGEKFNHLMLSVVISF